MRPCLDHMTHQPRGEAGDFKPGPRLPLPDTSQEAVAGNVLGPSLAQKMEDRPLTPVEGGEAGVGNLFDRGDVGVVPGAGVGGGSGARGRGGLGLGDSGGGTRVGGVRPGPGGEGSGEGSGSSSLPSGGYQVKPRYPDSARRRGVEGTVIIKAYVTEQGRVEQVQVEQSAGHADSTRSGRSCRALAFSACPAGSAGDRHVGVDSRTVCAESMTEPCRQIG